MKRLDDFANIEKPHTAVHAQGQAAIDAFGRNELETALTHLGLMEEANLEVMRIVATVMAHMNEGSRASSLAT